MGTVALADLLRMSDSGDYSNWDFDLGEDNATQILMNDRTNRMQMEIANQNNLNNLKIAQNTNELNKKIAEDKNALDYKIFQETNQYNTPEAQKQRYLAAGLNPIAAMSSGSIGAGNAANYQTAQATAIPGAPMVAPQLNSPHLANSTRGVDIAAALTNIANSGKGFADTVVSLGRLKNETGLADTQNALNIAKALEARQNAKATEVNTNSIVPQQLRNMIAEYDGLVAKKDKTKAEEMLVNEQRRAIGAQIWKWISDYDLGLKNVEVARQRNSIEASGNPWKIGMDFVKRVGLDKKLEDWIKGNTNGSLNDIIKDVVRMPYTGVLGAWSSFKSLLSEETLGAGSIPFKPVVMLGDFLLDQLDKKMPKKSKGSNLNSSNTSVLNPTHSDSFE